MIEHTRNQKRMYRIHKQEEKILEQKLMIASLQQKVEQLENIRKEAIEFIKENNCIAVNKEYLPKDYEWCCSYDLLNILNKGKNEK